MTSQVEDDKLNTLKSEIRCILLSRKDGIGVKEFLRDYKTLVGKNIPVNQFGFKTISELLNSLPDTVKVVKQCDSEELLLPVVSESTAHINKLVIGQKEQKKCRRPRPIQLPTYERTAPAHIRAPPRPPPGFNQDNANPSRGWENVNMRSLRHSQSSTPPFPPPPPLMNFQFNPPWMGSGTYSTPKWPQSCNSNNPMYIPEHQLNGSNYPPIPPGAPGGTTYAGQKLLESKRESVKTNSTLNGSDPKKFTSKDSPEEDKEVDLSNKKQNKSSKNSERSMEGPKENEESDNMSDIEDDSFSFNDKIKENFRQLLKEHPNGILSTKFSQAYKEKFNSPLSYYDYGYRSVHEMATALPGIFSTHPSKTSRGVTDWILFDASSKAMSEDSSKWIPRQVIENMLQLSLIYPNGIAGDDVASTYKTKFKVPLDVKKLGFENMTSFLMNCPSVMCTVKEDKSIVYPVNWGKDANSEEEITNTDELGLPVEHVEFLWKDLFPSHYCNPSFKFAKFVLPDTTTMKIVVADALSPELIWLQRLEYSDELRDLMADLNSFYEEHGNDHFLTESMIVPGLACASKFMDQWHRALICQPRDGDIKLLYIDYGTTEYVKLKDIRVLLRKFSDLPIQALRAKLHGICPVNKYDGWSSEATEFLFSICLNKTFVADIVKKKPEIPSVEVILNDVNDNDDKVVNKLMILNGFARAENELFKLCETIYDESSNASKNSSQSDEPCRMEFSLLPHYFLNLLPTWLNVTKNWEDVYTIFQQAKENGEVSACNGKKSNFVPPSCCAHHLFSNILINNPEVFCSVWRETIKTLGDKIERQFLQNLSPHISTKVEWKNCLKFCDSEEEYDNSQLEVQNHYQASNNNHAVCSNDSSSFIELKKENIALNSSIDKVSSVDEHSVRSFSPSQESESKLPYNICSQNGLVLTQKYVLDKWFTFILYNDKVFLLRDELLKNLSPTSYSPELFKIKLRGIKTSVFNFISIGPKLNTSVYEQLVAICLVRVNEKTFALPLEKVGTFIKAMLPTCADYANKFKELSEGFDPANALKFMDSVY